MRYAQKRYLWILALLLCLLGLNFQFSSPAVCSATFAAIAYGLNLLWRVF
jgi:hypothetical protein